jgi:hypothetical protein
MVPGRLARHLRQPLKWSSVTGIPSTRCIYLQDGW